MPIGQILPQALHETQFGATLRTFLLLFNCDIRFDNVPIGQKLHQALSLKKKASKIPSKVVTAIIL